MIKKGFIQSSLLIAIISLTVVVLVGGAIYLHMENGSGSLSANVVESIEEVQETIVAEKQKSEKLYEEEILENKTKDDPTQKKDEKPIIAPVAPIKITQSQEYICKSFDEICDGKDNDCDNLIDEELFRRCGLSDIGACQFGIQSCSNGIWEECSGAVESSDELCDGIDNDCDGMIDENLSRKCGTSNIGVCQFGLQSCLSALWGSCIGTVEPIQEVCDSKDNDCDGVIDEENICTIVFSSTPADPAPLSDIEEFYQGAIGLSIDKECGSRLNSGTLPDGTSFVVNVGCYFYKGIVQEKYIQLGFLGSYYPLSILLKYNIKPSEVNRTRLDILKNCEFMSKQWNQEIIHSIEVNSGSVYYDIFNGEGLPVPTSQTIDFHSSYQHYYSLTETEQEEWAKKLDTLKDKYHFDISFNIATLIWGWKTYLY